ncbi:MAG: Integron-associated effector binding protein [Labilithrix sp.]|nr:Integron-associated effector binding protein [Labilithrix sp.]
MTLSTSTQDLSRMYVLGVSCETNNADAMKDIGELWARAGAAGLLSGSAHAWAAYHHYELKNGGYAVTVTVGRAATADEAVPEGLARIDVPAQRCMHIATNGSIDAIRDAWSEVWGRWPDGGPRAFAVDVEHWQMGPDGRPASADVYVGLRATE